MPKQQHHKPVILDGTTFEHGFNGWTFKSWMPPGRQVSIAIKESVGYAHSAGAQINADGQDDDGIFYLEKLYHGSDVKHYVLVSWSFAPYDSDNPIGSWPRVVYVGAIDDLAHQDRQHDFIWLENHDNLVALPGNGNWNTHYYIQLVEKPLDQIQICVGWKINWETKRDHYLDNIVVALG